MDPCSVSDFQLGDAAHPSGRTRALSGGGWRPGLRQSPKFPGPRTCRPLLRPADELLGPSEFVSISATGAAHPFPRRNSPRSRRDGHPWIEGDPAAAEARGIGFTFPRGNTNRRRSAVATQTGVSDTRSPRQGADHPDWNFRGLPGVAPSSSLAPTDARSHRHWPANIAGTGRLIGRRPAAGGTDPADPGLRGPRRPTPDALGLIARCGCWLEGPLLDSPIPYRQCRHGGGAPPKFLE